MIGKSPYDLPYLFKSSFSTFLYNPKSYPHPYPILLSFFLLLLGATQSSLIDQKINFSFRFLFSSDDNTRIAVYKIRYLFLQIIVLLRLVVPAAAMRDIPLPLFLPVKSFILYFLSFPPSLRHLFCIPFVNPHTT